MKYLTIIRHAKSSWDSPATGDEDRPLNERGKKAAGVIGKYLKEKGICPDLMISSPAKRARDTAARIGKIMDYPLKNVEVKQCIYPGNVKEIRQVLCGLNAKFNDVFLFGHEPALSRLIDSLTGETVEKFPTCSAYRIAFDIKIWSAVRSQKGKCEFFVFPKKLLPE